MKNVRVFYELLQRGRLVLLLLLALGLRPPAARASYTCFYEGYHQPGGQPQRLAGHVDAATGAYLQEFTFNVLPNAGMPITAGMLYNSGDASLGPFGPGTSTPQDWFIVDDPTYGELLLGPGNVASQFNHYDANTGDYTDSFDPFLLGATLAPIPAWQGGGSALTWPDGQRWTFDTSGGLVQMLDGYGNGMNIARDATTGFVTTVSAIGSSGYVSYDLTADFYGNHYGQVKTVFPGGAAHIWSCGYDGSSPSGYRKLLTLTQPDGNAWHFAYSTNYYRPGTFTSLMPVHTLTDPRGNIAVTLTWDSSGRMTSVAYPGMSLSFSWNAAWGANGTVTGTNAGGHSTAIAFTWLSNRLGYLPTSVTDNTLGETTTLTYGNLPSNYLQTATTDFRGRTTTFAWDNSTGHLLSRSWTTPLGATASESFGYDPTSGGLTSSTDALNRTTTDTVDACACVKTVTDPRGHTTSDTRDSHGNITAITNALNQTSTLTYNGSAQLLTSTDPLSHTTTRTYDSYLRPATVQDANGKTVSYTYDAMDRVLTTSQTVNGVVLTTTNVYDANGNRTQMTDPKGQVWQWSFDAMNRVTAATDPLNHSQTISYNSDGNIATVVDRDGNTCSYAYDTADRLTSKTFTKPGGAPDSTVTYTYDATTHLLDVLWDNAAQPSYWKWFFYYDSLDRLKEVDTPYGNILIGLNDKLNRRDTVQEGAQGQIAYGFDNDDNITSITQNGATATLTYDALNRLTQQSLPATPNPVTTAWSFDNAGFLSSVLSSRNGTTLDSHTYLRDAVGNITQETLAGQTNSTSVFAYDDLYRLTSATVNATSYVWSYDPVGNRLSQTAGGVTTSYTYNAADQLTAVNGATVSSDLDGNVTNDGAGGVYTWDARSRLTGLTKNGNTYVFKYGPDNLRTYKSVNGVVTQYMLDGDQVVTEKINGVANQTLYGPGTDHPLARNGEFFLPNHASSTTALTDASGNLTQSYLYGPFGDLLNAPTDSNPFQYTGRENDGDGLLYYRARYYCPAWGRFISADPADSGLNPYEYAGNNPVGYSDPSGLEHEFDPVNQNVFDPSHTNGNKPNINRDGINAESFGSGTVYVQGGAAPGGGGSGEGGRDPAARAGGEGPGFFGTVGNWLSNIRKSVVRLFRPGDRLPRGVGETPRFPAGTPTGSLRPGNIKVQPGNNPPAIIYGRLYSGHALDRMQERGYFPMVIEDAIDTGASRAQAHGTTLYWNSQVVVVVNANGEVVTVHEPDSRYH